MAFGDPPINGGTSGTNGGAKFNDNLEASAAFQKLTDEVSHFNEDRHREVESLRTDLMGSFASPGPVPRMAAQLTDLNKNPMIRFGKFLQGAPGKLSVVATAVGIAAGVIKILHG